MRKLAKKKEISFPTLVFLVSSAVLQADYAYAQFGSLVRKCCQQSGSKVVLGAVILSSRTFNCDCSLCSQQMYQMKRNNIFQKYTQWMYYYTNSVFGVCNSTSSCRGTKKKTSHLNENRCDYLCANYKPMRFLRCVLNDKYLVNWQVQYTFVCNLP